LHFAHFLSPNIPYRYSLLVDLLLAFLLRVLVDVQDQMFEESDDLDDGINPDSLVDGMDAFQVPLNYETTVGEFSI
jgi:hypothetical protein